MLPGYQDGWMLVFIDESGDAGFKLDRGSTNVFAVAMVVFDDCPPSAPMAQI